MLQTHANIIAKINKNIKVNSRSIFRLLKYEKIKLAIMVNLTKLDLEKQGECLLIVYFYHNKIILRQPTETMKFLKAIIF